MQVRDLTDDTPSVAFFDSTFEEALSLAQEVRDFLISGQSGAGKDEAVAEWRLVASCETLRMTARVTQVIAWLIVQRAVIAGELSRTEASESRYRLGGQAICEPGSETELAGLPQRLVALSKRTGQLYERVARLDAMVNGARS